MPAGLNSPYHRYSEYQAIACLPRLQVTAACSLRHFTMSGPLEMDLMPQPEHNSLPATRSRESIVATIRRRTSRIFGRDVPDMPENTASSIPAGPLGNKRSWFDSIGARFSRKDQAAPELEQQSSQDARVELREVAGTSSTSSTASTTTPTGSSPSGTSPARSHQKRRFLRGGRAFKLQSLPAKFRRGGAAIFRWSSSSGSSTDDKEDAPMLNAANTRVVSTGSWNSFRIGVPKNPRGKRPPDTTTFGPFAIINFLKPPMDD